MITDTIAANNASIYICTQMLYVAILTPHRLLQVNTDISNSAWGAHMGDITLSGFVATDAIPGMGAACGPWGFQYYTRYLKPMYYLSPPLRNLVYV